MRSPTATRPTSPCSRFRSASRSSAIRTQAWTPRQVRSKSCSSSRQKTRRRVSATRPGRRTFVRWRAKHRAWPLRAPRPRRRNPGKKPRTKVPLLVVANSPDKEAALAGLERWKSKHPEVARLLAVDDVLVDSMRGRSSTWTRIRVNLRNVPEALRPPQETPDPDDDPTREWRTGRKARQRSSTLRMQKMHERTRLTRSSSGRRRKSPPAPAAEQLRAGHRCSRSASCPCAIFETAPCDGSGCPACGRKRLRPPARDAAAPRTGPCPGSSGSGRQACDARLHRSLAACSAQSFQG